MNAAVLLAQREKNKKFSFKDRIIKKKVLYNAQHLHHLD
jgi:hypothetical protein